MVWGFGGRGLILERKLKRMRASKINQLNNALDKIIGLNKEIENAKFNNESEVKIYKLQEREEKANIRAYAICATMTEEEYDATSFEDLMCMDYQTAKN
jgi:tRNA U54 and U55 pseudouridine synthase Pus10